MFDPWRLRTLLALSQRGTMAAVAEEFSLSGSAVSQQIAALEREAGVPLIEPDRRGVRLTVAGRALAAHADGILAAMRAASDELHDIDTDAIGEVRIASFPSAAGVLCPRVIVALAVEHPGHHVVLRDVEPHQSIAALRAGEVDVAIVDGTGLPDARLEPHFQVDELLVDPLFCMMAADHPAARRSSVVLDDLANERWVMEDEASWYHRQVMELFEAAGVQPKVVAYCRTFIPVIALVRARVGLSIQPGLALTGFPGIVARPLKPARERRVYVVYRHSAVLRRSIRTLLAALRDEASRRGAPVVTQPTDPHRCTRTRTPAEVSARTGSPRACGGNVTVQAARRHSVQPVVARQTRGGITESEHRGSVVL